MSDPIFQAAASVKYIPRAVSIAFINTRLVLFEVRGYERRVLDVFDSIAALENWLRADYDILEQAAQEAARKYELHIEAEMKLGKLLGGLSL